MNKLDWQTPDELYPGLFEEVQKNGVFADSKTFCDLVPKANPQGILKAWQEQHTRADFDLQAFLDHSFFHPASPTASFQSRPEEGVAAHISRLWPYLNREADSAEPGSSRIPLPNAYVVPGGRFQEMYYWDSYFTMLGLLESGMESAVRRMLDNFAWMIDQFGSIPNGNRTYFLSRSQPPFFGSMVKLLARFTGAESEVYSRYGQALLREYRFWMDGQQNLRLGEAHRRVVRLPGGQLLNRYWDDRAEPRQESWREDVDLAARSKQSSTELWRDIRAACESGWDFSSRWLTNPIDLATIRTTSLLPVDLNCMLFELESVIAEAAECVKELAPFGDEFREAARTRSALLKEIFWNSGARTFCDVDMNGWVPSQSLTLAMLFPLFVGVATDEQAHHVAELTQNQFLKPGGLVTSLVQSGQQWDAPNGWAPLQWVGAEGLAKYGHLDLSEEIRTRWMALNERVFASTGKMMEKYHVEHTETTAGGGEYPNQDGFGWTNGVYLAMSGLTTGSQLRTQ